MNELLMVAVRAALGFSWPVPLSYAKGVSPFWIGVVTSTGTICYLSMRAGLGKIEIGQLSVVALVIMYFCGMQNGFGMENYSKLFTNPIYMAIALVLTQIFLVVGMWFLHTLVASYIPAFIYMKESNLNYSKIIGLTLGASGVYFMNR